MQKPDRPALTLQLAQRAGPDLVNQTQACLFLTNSEIVLGFELIESKVRDSALRTKRSAQLEVLHNRRDRRKSDFNRP
jgi:hypothetical protein